MINSQKLIKVSVVWTSIVYAVCFALVALIAPVRTGFIKYGLHMDMSGVQLQYVMTFTTFISGIIIWNIIAVLVVWLFVGLWNRIK